jgi:hypothetical protein
MCRPHERLTKAVDSDNDDISGQRRREHASPGYRSEWLDNLADHVTIEGSALTGIAEGPEAIRAVLVVNHRPLRSGAALVSTHGEHFAGTRYARYFLTHDAAEALHEVTEHDDPHRRPVPRRTCRRAAQHGCVIPPRGPR